MGKALFLLVILASATHGEPQGYSYPSIGLGFRPSRPRPPPYGSGSVPDTYKPASSFGNFGYGGNGGSGGGSKQNFPPANYQFQYDVSAPQSGAKFGHQESRVGNSARGRYYVLLPDGRTQVVEYTADETGYHPRISYS